MREVLTYARRGSRFTNKQQEAWDTYAERWYLADEVVHEQGLRLEEWFGREAPLVVEIGCGIGEATGVLASKRPDSNVLAFEVWRPGVADTLGNVAAAGADNVRVTSVDAVWAFAELLSPGQISELWTFYPDPWPKKKHHKRRLITPDNAALIASRLAPGAVWRLATDWPHYADQIDEVLGAEESLIGGRVERWQDRPSTRFERRGVAAGRPLQDFAFCRQ